jgi:hypothetical protein
MVRSDPRYDDPKFYSQVMEDAGKQARDNKMMAMWYYSYAQKPLEN